MELFERVLGVGGFTSPIGSEVFIGVFQTSVSGFYEISSSSGTSRRSGVNISDSGELDNLFGGGGGDNSGSSGGGNHSNSDGSGLSVDFGGHGVCVSNHISPISSSDGDHVQFSVGNRSFNGSLNFFVGGPSQTDVSVTISDNHVSFESHSLSGGGLFLNGVEGHDFFS